MNFASDSASRPPPSPRRAGWWDCLDGRWVYCFVTFEEAVARQRALAALADWEYETDEEAWKDFLDFREAVEYHMQ